MEEKRTRVYQCEDSLTGILTAVAAAYRSRYGHRYIRLELREAEENLTLFSDYIPIAPDEAEAKRVYRAAGEAIGAEGLRWIENAALSTFADRSEEIYRFLIRGFANKNNILSCVADPHVARMYEIDRAVTNDACRWTELLRFQTVTGDVLEELSLPEDRALRRNRTEEELLIARIRPKHRVLPRILPHFADRYHGERFLIYDEAHEMTGIYLQARGWTILTGEAMKNSQIEHIFSALNKDERQMRELWKIFYQATEIPERENKALQRNVLPLWTREYLCEFSA